MRFMMIIKGNKESEAGKMPDEKLLAAMTKYNEELAKAGVLLDLAGLQPTSQGAKLRYDGKQLRVLDGPFSEAKEVIAGYWIINVKSKQEAIEWAKRIPWEAGDPSQGEGEVELRPFYELEDFGPSQAIDRARELEKELTKKRS
jgi:hypothetical protein